MLRRGSGSHVERMVLPLVADQPHPALLHPCPMSLPGMQAFKSSVQAHPHLLLLWLLVLCLGLGFGFLAVFLSAKGYVAREKDEATSMAEAILGRLTLAIEVRCLLKHAGQSRAACLLAPKHCKSTHACVRADGQWHASARFHNHSAHAVQAATVPARAMSALAHTHWMYGFEDMNATFSKHAPYFMDLVRRAEDEGAASLSCWERLPAWGATCQAPQHSNHGSCCFPMLLSDPWRLSLPSSLAFCTSKNHPQASRGDVYMLSMSPAAVAANVYGTSGDSLPELPAGVRACHPHV